MACAGRFGESGWFGHFIYHPARSHLTGLDLLTLMITRSDNTATTILIGALSMSAINQRMQTPGLTWSRSNRVMMDTVAARQGRENYVTAREMTGLLRTIYQS